MTMPSKTWVRRRVPSTTWKCTRTRSPGGEPRDLAQLRCSMLSMIVLMVVRARRQAARAEGWTGVRHEASRAAANGN